MKIEGQSNRNPYLQSTKNAAKNLRVLFTKVLIKHNTKMAHKLFLKYIHMTIYQINSFLCLIA